MELCELIDISGVEISNDNVPVEVIPNVTITVLGVADIGIKSPDGTYNACYRDDVDNYLDITLQIESTNSKDDIRLALEGGLQVLCFSKGEYLYNPGGPAPTPVDNARYTAPAPANQLIDIVIDLDDEKQTTLCLYEGGRGWSKDPEVCEAWHKDERIHSVPVEQRPLNRRSCPPDIMERVNTGDITEFPSSSPPPLSFTTGFATFRSWITAIVVIISFWCL